MEYFERNGTMKPIKLVNSYGKLMFNPRQEGKSDALKLYNNIKRIRNMKNKKYMSKLQRSTLKGVEL